MLTIPDYSEFQGHVVPTGFEVVILRAHNGWRADNYFAANRASARSCGVQAIGLYQYLPSSVDAATAARELLATIGSLAGNEWLILDLEEGAAGQNQQARWQAWRQVIVAATGRQPWLYSFESFSKSNGLTPDWLADYSATEPASPAHKLWQNTDAYPWPWGRADGSRFNGTLAQFMTATEITPPTPEKAMAQLSAPIVAIVNRPQNDGYWLIGEDGGTFAFGKAPVLADPAVGKLSPGHLVRDAVCTPSGAGLLIAASDGGVFALGDAHFQGGLGNFAPSSVPIEA